MSREVGVLGWRSAEPAITVYFLCAMGGAQPEQVLSPRNWVARLAIG
ncbi:MAG: hypothetical protein AAFY20_05490 [Cyanobacteria bacterium J06639_14]